MPTSHFLGQVWEFPFVALLQHSIIRTTVIFRLSVFLLFMLSIMFMIPLSHSHEILGIKSAPALARARQKRRSGSSRKCPVQTVCCTEALQWQKAKWEDPGCFLLQDSCSHCRCSGEEDDTKLLFRARCIFSWLAAGIRVICVCPLCHSRVSLSLPSMGCHVSTVIWLRLTLRSSLEERL